MEQEFLIEGSIATMQNAAPIRFVHRKGMDKPENHVLHINNYLEVYVYVQGNHKYIVENRIYELKKGDIVCITPREVHKALPISNCLYERFYLLVDVRCLDALAQNPLEGILNPSAHSGNLVSLTPKLREQALALLYGISECFRDGRNQQTKALGEVLQLLAICNEHKRQETTVASFAAPVPELLGRILAYVAENTAAIQSTAQIAQALGVSPQYLSTYFAKHIGTSLSIYVQTKKIALAKTLLDKGADVTGACFDSGFNDCSYFIRVFKKHMGITPLRYRQSLGL